MGSNMFVDSTCMELLMHMHLQATPIIYISMHANHYLVCVRAQQGVE